MAWLIRRDHLFEDNLILPSLAGEHSDDWETSMADNGAEDLFHWILSEGSETLVDGFSTDLGNAPLMDLMGRGIGFSYMDLELVYPNEGIVFHAEAL